MKIKENPGTNTEILNDWEIFTKIWINPRKIFRFIEDNSFDKYIPFLGALIGITSTISRAIEKNLGDTMGPGLMILYIFVSGILFGWVYFFLYSIGISFIGNILKGKASSRSIFRIMCYASIPFIISNINVCLALSIVGYSLFQASGNSFYESGTGMILSIIDLLMVIWSSILVVVGLSEIQGFPIWKALLNYILPAFILLSFIWGILVLF